MAAYDGYDLGLVEEFASYANPNDRQTNAYAGVNGLESINLGARGGTTTLRGVLFADSAFSLAALQNRFRQLQAAGQASALVTPDGLLWLDVILVAFRPTGMRFNMASFPGVGQRYDAEFLHVDG